MQTDEKTGKEHLSELLRLRQRVSELEQCLVASAEEVKRFQAQSNLYYNALSSLHAAVVLVSEDSRVLFTNQSFCDLFSLGCPPEELIGLSSSEVLSRVLPAYEDPAWVARRIQELVSQGVPVRGEEVRFRDGRTCLCDFLPVFVDGKRFGRLWHHSEVTAQNRVEEEIRLSEAQKTAILNGISTNIAFVDKDMKILWVNKAAAASVNKTPEEMIGRSCHSFWADPARPCENCPTVKAFKTRHSERAIIRTPDGRVWDERGEPVFDTKGNVIGVVEIADDITERMRAEEVLRRSERENFIMNQISRAFLTISDEMIYEEVLAVILKSLDCKYGVFGYMAENGDLVIPSMTREIWDNCRVEGKSIVFPPDQWGDSLWGKAIRERKSFSSSGPFHTPEGHLSIYNFVTVPIVYGDKTIGLLSVANKEQGFSEEERNILERIAARMAPILHVRLERDREELERKRAEEALRDRDIRFKKFSSNVPGMIYQFMRRPDGAYCVPFTSEAIKDIFGCSPEDVVNDFSPIAKVIHPEDLDNLIRSLESSAERMSIWEHTYRVQIPGQPVRWMHGHSTPEKLPDGSIVWYGFNTDITETIEAEEERKMLEERLQRAEKMEALGILAGGVTHDLNNVLGIVVGYSELLLNDLKADTPERKKALEVMKGGQRAAAIVQDLLTLARRGVQGRKVMNVNQVIQECLKSPELFKLLAHHPGIRIKVDLEPDLLNISGSPVHLTKSILNLISNAAEAMPRGGTITVRTANKYVDRPVSGYDEVKEGDYVVVAVSDTGEGISVADRKRIFEPFYTRKVMGRSGTGLGLAVVWGTVKDHQGYINVESDEGKGSVFTLYFPVTRGDLSQEEVCVSADEFMGRGETILVVDDVREQRELASTMLGRLGYKVWAACSGEEAVEYLRKNKVDLVILDMIMDPGMDGLDTYAKILEIHPGQKAVIVSGFSETERVGKARELGAGAYVKKPYVLEKLGLAVRKELDRLL